LDGNTPLSPMNNAITHTVEVDASTVYAEGFVAGLREALRIVARDSRTAVPIALRRAVTSAEATAIHREWQSIHGRSVPHAQSEQALAQIHIVLNAIEAKSHE
jgi:hypothetical protein